MNNLNYLASSAVASVLKQKIKELELVEYDKKIIASFIMSHILYYDSIYTIA